MNETGRRSENHRRMIRLAPILFIATGCLQSPHVIDLAWHTEGQPTEVNVSTTIQFGSPEGEAGATYYATGAEGTLRHEVDTYASSIEICGVLWGWRQTDQYYVAVGLSDRVCNHVQLDSPSVSASLTLIYAP